MGTLRLDLRFAIRTLVKKPLFTIVAITTLALSIGANTAIFSVVNAVLLRALPYHNADRLIVLSTNSGGGNIDGMSVPEAEDYRAQMKTSLEDAAFFQSQSVNLTGTERPDRVRGAFVSANYFRFFNLNPVLGRAFADGEDSQGGPRLAVVNEKMWRERLNGDANLNDKKLTLPKENAGRTARLVSFREMMVRGVRPMLWLLFAAVGVILLIGCANLANLLLARGLDRHKEVAVRAALGASRWRLIRELLTETTLISVIGGVLGVFLAYWGLYGLLKLPQNFVNAQDANLDLRVLLFALAISVATGWLFGLAPALQFAKPDLRSFLKEGARGGGEGARWNRLRSGFVIAQVALSLVLLVSAGLLIRSFDKLLRVNVGFKPEQLLSLEYRLPRNKYKEAPAQWAFHRQVMDRIQQVPGVQSVALVRGLPFSGNGATTAITLPDREAPPKGREPEVMFNSATPNYFETIGIPFVKGRLFDDHDQPNTPPVVVINQTMARKFWPNHDPIGKQVKSVQDGSVATVIGVVGDAKHYWLEEDQMPQMYGAYSQQPGFFATVLIRTKVEPLSLSEQVRQALWKVDADQPMWKIRTVEFLVNRSVSDRKFLLALMGLFASLALVLTMIGLYGVISYLVKQRTQEIGIRIALGAQVRDILQMVLKQGMFLVLTGVALGLTTAWLTTRLISSLLYQVSATDPVTFAVIAAFLIVVALLACYLPARRATKVDPLVALRYE
jgi:putative ABC transport system permease protein